MKTPEGLPGIDGDSFTLESTWKPTSGKELEPFVGEPKEPILTMDLKSDKPVAAGPLHLVVKREHNIIHHFLGSEWIGSSLPNIADEELDESRWKAMAKPLG